MVELLKVTLFESPTVALLKVVLFKSLIYGGIVGHLTISIIGDV